MTPDEQTDIIWRLKQQTFWPHAETIREDCGDGLKLIAHLNDTITSLVETVEKVTQRDAATVNLDQAIELGKWRAGMARLMAQLDDALAEARSGDYVTLVDDVDIPVTFDDVVVMSPTDWYPHTQQGDAA